MMKKKDVAASSCWSLAASPKNSWRSFSVQFESLPPCVGFHPFGAPVRAVMVDVGVVLLQLN